MPRTKTTRVEFTKEHDIYLAKYLAKYSPSTEGRRGNAIFKRLADNKDNQWPWSVHHTWVSWRERYVKNAEHFDKRIAKYQAKAKHAPGEKRKRASGSGSFEGPKQSVKRIKLEANKEEEEEEEEEDRGEGPSGQRHPDTRPTPTPQPDALPSTPQRIATNADREKSLPTARQSSPLMDDAPPTKQLQKRWRASSEIFTSEASSPLAAPRPYPRAPPRFVNLFDGQVLADQNGRVPRAFPLEKVEEGEEEEEEEEEKEKEEASQWPPLRGRAVKQKKGGPDVGHHPFSQSQPPSRPPMNGTQERSHPFEWDRRAVVAQFMRDSVDHRDKGIQTSPPPEQQASPTPKLPSKALKLPTPRTPTSLPSQPGSSATPLRPSERDSEGERERPHPFETEVIVVNHAFPVKRAEPKSRAGPAPKSPKFPEPRPSTESPFRLEEARPKPRSPPWTKAARHPALMRIQRQGRPERDVPSVDLVELARSPAFAKSSRGSLPVFRPLPWVEGSGTSSAPGSVLGSRSTSGSPFRWAAPTLVPFTPSPARSVTGSGTDGGAIVRSSALDSFLRHMSANHGFERDMVEKVYEEVRDLKKTDDSLRAMRERRAQDDDDDDYRPPATSRAALWKRRAEHKEDDRQGDLFMTTVMEGLHAQVLEREMGRTRFHQEIFKRFDTITQ